MIEIQHTVVYSAVAEEPDRRYRMMVLLARTNRPTNFKWHCPRCTKPLGELINVEPIAVTDVMDMTNPDMVAVGFRCDGRYDGERCNVYYYYSLNS